MRDIIDSQQRPRASIGGAVIDYISTSRVSALSLLAILLLLCQCSCGDDTCYSGQQYRFSIPNDDDYTCLWSATAGSYSDNINPTFDWTAPVVTRPTDVRVSVIISNKNAASCNEMGSLDLTVLPVTITGPEDQSVLEGETVSFGVSVIPEVTYDYTWQVKRLKDDDFQDVSPRAIGNSYQFKAKLKDDGNQYRVQVSGPFGTLTSDIASLGVKSLKKAISGTSTGSEEIAIELPNDGSPVTTVIQGVY